MRNPTFIAHTPIATAIATLFLFQMAILGDSMSVCFVEMIVKRNIDEDLHAKNDQ
jgi:hypothetical protein